jgi:hypothetical protein
MRVKRHQKVTEIYENIPVLNEKVPKKTVLDSLLIVRS